MNQSSCIHDSLNSPCNSHSAATTLVHFNGLLSRSPWIVEVMVVVFSSSPARKYSKMRTKVLRLYKDLLRFGEKLQFTDKKYFKYRIKKSFAENKDLDDPKTIKFHIEKGREALARGRVV
ncbi:uncharacterized protein [Venturia canescens]|uniref:uncharacterized protein isoform X2 n=1 Tax=Venturia canescens TaxID=32260 RepID=UPI001C9C4117|nr:uncharacterized protein LOC122406720 isoform X2 [Venturia canescens]